VDITEQQTDEPVRPSGRFVRSGTPQPEPERTPRPRQEPPEWSKPLLRPFFRYSYGRDAYVLRAFGAKHGPVLLDLDDPAR
jgi:hypothetical protein